jgi:hypothetical protein
VQMLQDITKGVMHNILQQIPLYVFITNDGCQSAKEFNCIKKMEVIYFRYIIMYVNLKMEYNLNNVEIEMEPL